MHIREANLTDARAIARVHVDSWRQTYSGIVPDDYLASLSYEQRERAWQNILSRTDNSGFVLIAEDDAEEVIGFASGGPARDEEPDYAGELYAIYILQAHQRKGIGTRLTMEVAKRLIQKGIRSMMVWVLAENPSCQFYEAVRGEVVKQQDITIGGVSLPEVAYGWPDIQSLVDRAQLGGE